MENEMEIGTKIGSIPSFLANQRQVYASKV